MNYLDTHEENCALIAYAVLEGHLKLDNTRTELPACVECGRVPKYLGGFGLCNACWQRQRAAKLREESGKQ
jgi:hypothetical protein